jgi:SET domain-containing protein
VGVVVPPAEPPVAAVGPSVIAGRGLFATRAIAAGETVPVEFAQLNHSCEPNVGWRPDGSLVAMRAIDEGHELTTDYALAADDPELIFTCHCETYRCRQLIEGVDWQIPQLQKRYAGYWAPDVQRRIDEGR